MARRTRNRQLARQVALRRAQRQRQQRRRQMATIAVALVIALVAGVVLFSTFVAGNDGTTASPTPTPNPTGEPGSQTGTVDPEPGPRRVACGADAPRDALSPKPQFNAPADVLEEGVTYTATFETSCGDIVVRLLSDRARRTVNSFVFLAEEHYFDGTRIHRIDESIDVLQGGDPSGTGLEGPGYTIPDELTGNETYQPGTLAMANSGQPDSGGSQFFIITGEDGHNLDASATYTIFGRIVQGLGVAREIQRIPIQDPGAGIEGQQPSLAVYIERVTISTDE